MKATHIGLIVLGAALVGGVAACASISREHDHADLTDRVAIVELRIENANSYLVYDKTAPEHALLIDLGIPENAEKLADRIRDAGVDPAELDAAIITHGHYDHAGGARYFQDTFDVPLIAGEGDREPLETGKELPVCPTSLMGRLIASESAEPGTWTSKPDYYVRERFDLSEISALGGEVIALPGHTPGSVIVNIGEAVFVGDHIRGKIFGAGPALHFFMCDLDDNVRDLDAILTELSPNAERIFPGHMSVFSRGDLHKYVRRYGRDDEL
ncbi:MAG: MBL fold metallo-hydrolase [Pseudomonadota bacterium]